MGGSGVFSLPEAAVSVHEPPRLPEYITSILAEPLTALEEDSWDAQLQTSWRHTAYLHKGLLSLCVLNSCFVLWYCWPFCRGSCHCNYGTCLESGP